MLGLIVGNYDRSCKGRDLKRELKNKNKQSRLSGTIERLLLLGPAAWFSAATSIHNDVTKKHKTFITSYDGGSTFSVDTTGDGDMHDVTIKVDGNYLIPAEIIEPGEVPEEAGKLFYQTRNKDDESKIVFNFNALNDEESKVKFDSERLDGVVDAASIVRVGGSNFDETSGGLWKTYTLHKFLLSEETIHFVEIERTLEAAEDTVILLEFDSLAEKSLERSSTADDHTLAIEYLTSGVNLDPEGIVVEGNAVGLKISSTDNFNGAEKVTFYYVNHIDPEVGETYDESEDADKFYVNKIILNVNFTPVNDAPAVSADVDLGSSAEDTSVALTAAQLLANASDVDTGDTLSVTNLTVSSGSLEATAGGWSYTPAANASGDVTFSYDVSDGTTSTAANARLSVTAVNNAPTGNVEILGKARVGETLFFDTSTVDDIDGMTEGAINWQVSGGEVTNKLSIDPSDQGSTLLATFSFVDGGGTTEILSDTSSTVEAQGFYDLRITDRPTDYEYRVGVFVTSQNTEAFDGTLDEYMLQVSFDPSLVAIDPNSVVFAKGTSSTYVGETEVEGVIQISAYPYTSTPSADVALFSFEVSPLQENLKEIPLALENISMDYEQHQDFDDILVPQLTGSVLGVDPGDILLPPPAF